MATPGTSEESRDFDVALSFSGTNRGYVSEVAEHLHKLGISFFYDDMQWESLWGKNAIDEFHRIYGAAKKHVVTFISKEYVENDVWTSIERQSAQAKNQLFRRADQYILPARFDDTELPGMPATTVYADLRKTSPEKLAQQIANMVNRADSGPFVPRFVCAEGQSRRANEKIQGIPIAVAGSEAAGAHTSIAETVRRVMEQRTADGTWAHRDNTEFDKIYATSSAVTFLLQAGLSVDSPELGPSIEYLEAVVRPHVDTRAAFSVLIPTRIADDALIASFLEELSTHQFKQGPGEGSFLLEQGPAKLDESEHWRHRAPHRDGTSFHACHLADLLLHISVDATKSRARATAILSGLRGYLVRNLRAGYLLDQDSNMSPITLFSYALLQRLAVPLPRNWREVTTQILGSLPQKSAMVRAFGVMNIRYMSDWITDAGFLAEGADYIRATLPELDRTIRQEILPVPDLAAIGRANIYGSSFLAGAHPYH
jgi:hypothetical protein